MWNSILPSPFKVFKVRTNTLHIIMYAHQVLFNKTNNNNIYFFCGGDTIIWGQKCVGSDKFWDQKFLRPPSRNEVCALWGSEDTPWHTRYSIFNILLILFLIFLFFPLFSLILSSLSNHPHPTSCISSPQSVLIVSLWRKWWKLCFVFSWRRFKDLSLKRCIWTSLPQGCSRLGSDISDILAEVCRRKHWDM